MTNEEYEASVRRMLDWWLSERDGPHTAEEIRRACGLREMGPVSAALRSLIPEAPGANGPGEPAKPDDVARACARIADAILAHAQAVENLRALIATFTEHYLSRM